MVKFIVYYKDDSHIKHMTFVSSIAEVKFIQERFSEVSFEIL